MAAEGHGSRAPSAGTLGRVWTLPNAISFLRLVSVPVFAYLIVTGHYLWALAVLVAASISDWLDGVLARALDQRSRLGELLDPIADRLYIAVALLTMAIRSLVPWWFVALILGREAILGILLLVMRRYGYPPPLVNFAGKAGTFMLMIAFPALLLAAWASGLLHDIAWVIAWAAALWGLGLYLFAGVLYVMQDIRLIRHARAVGHG